MLCLVTFVGIVLTVVGETQSQSSSLWGSLLLLSAGLAFALSTLYGKDVIAQIDAKNYTAVTLVLGAIWCVPFTLGFNHDWRFLQVTSLNEANVKAILALIYLGVFSSWLAYRLWNKGVTATPANTTARTEQHDFADFNEFTRALVNASGKGGSGQPDARLRRANAAPGAYASGLNGADGGFVIPPAFQDGIMEIVFAPEAFAGRCAPYRTTGRQLTIPFDPNAVYAPGGIKASWRGEGETGTQTKPVLEERELKLECVTGIVPITAEMLEDSPNIGDYVQRGLGRAVDWALTSAIMRGSGVKRPRGILAGDPSVPADNAGRIIVPKEVGQAAGTVLYKNILKMWSKLNGICRMNAVWVITQDVETELLTMTGPDNKLIYSPVPLNEKPYTTLLGRPVIVHPVASTIGLEGDISLIDFTQYALLTRSQNGLKFRYEASMYFLENIQQFGLDLRVGGQPLWHKPQPNDESGSSYSSYAVTLQARL